VTEVTDQSGDMGDTAGQPRVPACEGTGLTRRRKDGPQAAGVHCERYAYSVREFD
jgi:hypothetical protein